MACSAALFVLFKAAHHGSRLLHKALLCALIRALSSLRAWNGGLQILGSVQAQLPSCSTADVTLVLASVARMQHVASYR
jgi:hypothetical protein